MKVKSSLNNLDNFLYFDNHGQARKISNNHPNHFILSPVSKEGKLQYTKYYIQNYIKVEKLKEDSLLILILRIKKKI